MTTDPESNTVERRNQILCACLDATESVYRRWESLSGELYSGMETTCIKGCGACCHFPLIPATAGEAFVLYHLLQRMSSDLVALDGHLTAYAQRYLAHAREQGSLPFTDAQQKVAFEALHLPCPLFVSTGEGHAGHCGAFSMRPLICSYFHNLDSPTLCARKAPHRTAQGIVEAGEELVDELLNHERLLLGRSTLGHLPLLLAAFATEAGRDAFVRNDYADAEIDALPPDERQGAYDFSLLVDLLGALGYVLQESDVRSLMSAQEELIKG